MMNYTYRFIVHPLRPSYNSFNMVNDARELLSENVRLYRGKNKLTQHELAERTHLSDKHIASIEAGTSFISYTSVCKLAEALNVSLSSLFYTESEREGREAEDKRAIERYLDELRADLEKKD